MDESGYGTFSITTIQGTGGKNVSFICAYSAVQKGSDIGTESLFAQQVSLHEKKSTKTGIILSRKFFPRVHAVKLLNDIIQDLQQKITPSF